MRHVAVEVQGRPTGPPRWSGRDVSHLKQMYRTDFMVKSKQSQSCGSNYYTKVLLTGSVRILLAFSLNLNFNSVDTDKE